ncbi:MAG: hypothetical protein M1550_00905 [Deltaproteobacteria bacterium]|nr:hypothetical protein [Deltaproteobacteria bacterium]
MVHPGKIPQVFRVSPFRLVRSILCLAAAIVLVAGVSPARAQESVSDPKERRIEDLEKAVRQLSGRVEELSASRSADNVYRPSRFTFGGYGEIHANLGRGNAPHQIDIHRLVAYVGYEFADWIRFHSETEIEHAFVSRDSEDGEISIEQAYFDFLLSDRLNVRAGRFLTPLGLINRKHEPPTFNGVERPLFDRIVIPSTWFSDGAGIFGSLGPSLKYEAYVAGGLDGSKIDATDGIREARIEERPGLHQPAVTGRIDWFPFARRAAAFGQTLRVGAGGYYGGLNNGNGGNNPGVGGRIRILSADFEYGVGRFDARGAVAHERVGGAAQIGNGAASEIFGWNLEGAVHVMPGSWRTGKLSRADAVVFIRYDDVDTQYGMPPGVAKDPAGDRQEWTTGLDFYFTHNLVAKADYQVRRDKSAVKPDDLFNLGLGWQF